MRILLIGEFSGLHSDLTSGLIKNGHEVTFVAFSDSFKKIPVQINIDSNRSGLIGKIFRRFNALKISFQFIDYDVVQVINPWVFGRFFPYKWFYSRLKRKNKRLFFLAAGTDAYYWRNAKALLRYSPIDDMINIDKGNNHSYMNTPKSFNFNEWCLNISDGIIPIMYDYAVCYLNHPKLLKTIPIPIDISKVKFYGITNKSKIHLFHGLNRRGIKGTHYIEEAFNILQNKHSKILKMSIDGKLPFNEYLEVLKNTDIVIDQASSHSLGMNGLYSMAMGKIVLGGAEPESLSMYSTKTPAINILPNPKKIAETIEILINNKNLFLDISKKSREFIEKEHDHVKIAVKFVKTWENS